jgi:hypothetical chaperone protein
MAVEAAKIELSDTFATPIHLAALVGMDSGATRQMFDDAVEKPVGRIAQAINYVLADSGVRPEAVGTVFMTGGSSSLPVVQACVAAALPGVTIAKGDLLGSVGTGLALDAKRRFA